MLMTGIIFFVIISILVFVHELGHYLVARWIGVKVEEFGFGLPPRIWGKQVGKTIYSLNWLPIGGFVKLAGEDQEEVQSAKFKVQSIKQYFWARTKKERASILLAGVAMNFVLAVAITAYLLTGGLNVLAGRVNIVQVQPGTPAEKAGLRSGDVIVSMIVVNASGIEEEKEIRLTQEVKALASAHLGQVIILTILRSDQKLKINLTPRTKWPEGQGPMGIVLNDLKELKSPWWRAPWDALVLNLERLREMLLSLGSLVYRLVSFKQVGQEIAGPVGIAQITGQAVRYGWRAVLEFMSILSLNLAVLNILPIPALDGGRLAFVFLEKAIGRRLRPAFERSTHQIGMIILFALIFLVSLNDILRLARGG